MIKMTNYVLGCIFLALIAGFLFGKGCTKQEKLRIYDKDTVNIVKTVARPVFVKPEVKIRTILVPYRDTMLVKTQIPCDTPFIAHSDSIITTTNDTIHVAFTNNPATNSYFSILFRPRPDSIITTTVKVPVETVKTTTDLGWVISAFAIGLGIGLLGASK